jgi:dienelactone hydrolase
MSPIRPLKVILALAAALAILSGQTLRPKAFPPEIVFDPSRMPQSREEPWLSVAPEGAEGAFDRQQRWQVPTPLPSKMAHAYLYRPPGDGPFRLAVIAHASTENAIRRAQMPQPEYRAMAAFLVARGFAVLVPERMGHGATGGAYLEDQRGCEHADYGNSGREVALQIELAEEAMRRQSFISKDGVVVIGHSAGGWGALDLAGLRRAGVSAIIVFAPGRGGHADDEPGKVCAAESLIKTAEAFGTRARIAVTWLVADNDSYFPPKFSRELADAFHRGGGKVNFIVLPAVGSEGHAMAETEEGVNMASGELDRALKASTQATAKKP